MLTRFTLLMGIIAATLAAAPVQYNITFNQTAGTGPVPTNGTFTYDANAALGSQFSVFSATWTGGSFDFLTGLPGYTANDPNVPATSCLPDTSNSTFLMMSGPLACNPAAVTTYSAFVSGSGQIFIQFRAVQPTQNPEITVVGAGPVFIFNGICTATNTSGCPTSSGTFTIAPAVPEPATWLLTLGGLGFATIARRLARS